MNTAPNDSFTPAPFRVIYVLESTYSSPVPVLALPGEVRHNVGIIWHTNSDTFSVVVNDVSVTYPDHMTRKELNTFLDSLKETHSTSLVYKMYGHFYRHFDPENLFAVDGLVPAQ